MHSVYFYVATSGFMLGVACVSVGLIDVWGLMLVGVCAGSLVPLAVVRRQVTYVVVCVALVALAVGASRMLIAERAFPTDLAAFEGQEVEVVGVVDAEPDHRERTTLVSLRVVQVEHTDVVGRVLVSVERRSTYLYGDRLHVQGTLRVPEAFETDLGRTFDYPGYLRARGISHTMSFAEVETIDHGNGAYVIAYLLEFKERISTSIERTLLAPEAGLALGILLGEKHALGSEVQQSFRDAGLIHIVVLSGYNIAIVVSAIMTLLASFSMRMRTILGGVAIVLFVCMVGPSATVVRAAVMAILILLAQATGNTYAIMRALMVAAVGMLLWNPHLLVHDPGFQLSFLATLGLIVLAPLIERSLMRGASLWGLKEFVSATLATQVMVAPLLVYAVGTFSFVSFISNVVILPVVPLAMLLSALTGVVGMFSEAAAMWVGYPTDLVLAYMVRVTELCAHIPYASVGVPPFGFWVVMVSYFFLCVAIAVAWMPRCVRTVPTPLTPGTKGDVFPF